MSRPGDISHRVIQVLDAAGNPKTGLVLAGFTIYAQGRGYGASAFTTWSHGTTLTELSGGYYDLAYALVPSAGWWRYVITSNAGYTVWNSSWEGETEQQDLDSIYANVVKTTATLATSAQLGNVVPLELIAYRYRQVDITILDSTGAPYPISTNFPASSLKLSVRSQDQTTTKFDAGPTGTPVGFTLTSSGSILTAIFPETSAFFSALAAGVASTSLYYEITGDLGGDATKTQPIIRSSPLTLSRREVGT